MSATPGTVSCTAFCASAVVCHADESPATKAATAERMRSSPSTPRTNDATASSNSGTGSVHDVRSLASRVAFSTYATARSADSGQAPTSVCQTSCSVAASGPAALRWSCASACQDVTASAHSRGHCASSTSRARTSSERLVSWVDSVVIDAGQSRERNAFASWNCASEIPNRPGSPPTSLSADNRKYR